MPYHNIRIFDEIIPAINCYASLIRVDLYLFILGTETAFQADSDLEKNSIFRFICMYVGICVTDKP